MVSPRHRLDADSDLDLVSASQFGTRERERLPLLEKQDLRMVNQVNKDTEGTC